MCTVTWLRHSNGYEVLCNRDEKLTRGVALPPRTMWQGGVAYIAPIDSDSGGTWIATNEFGLTLGLLNASGPTPADSQSRGLLVMHLIAARSAKDVQRRIAAVDLARFAPFQLVALDLDGATRLFEWSQSRLADVADASQRFPLTSSSFDSQNVCERRQRQFRVMAEQQGAVDRNLLLRFHASHEHTRGAYSTCMHRSDAATASFSHIRVSPGNSHFFYKAGPLCQPAPMYTASLAPHLYDSLSVRPWIRHAPQ